MNKDEFDFLAYLEEMRNPPMPKEETPEEFVATYDHIHYCECLILLNGNLLQVRPSHTILQTNLAKQYLKVADEHEFPMYEYAEFLYYATGAISVWYEFQQRTANYPMTPQQARTLQLLADTKKIKGIALSETYFRNREGYVPEDEYVG